ncbi:MAG: hypothetical protein LBF84_02610 [Holosporales bacterium]|jgi:Flp pilus assembly protein protease CpaA|nr:hypothetical protein [Holosporales bacterium]
MTLNFDVIDYILILSAVVLGTLAAYQDIKSRSFTVLTGLGIFIVGGVWCIKQLFIPITIFPIACSMGIALIIGRLIKRKVIGDGDILLLCSAGFFVTFNELPAFIVFCGAGGVLTYAIQRYICKDTGRSIPFIPAIVVSQWLTFFLYCTGG